ncbi:MAG: NHL repeat-containing protein [Defluviitaleaceae bacterium]|nr:NHL repeat-containing protein [Defluviitaleaceae bacterium]
MKRLVALALAAIIFLLTPIPAHATSTPWQSYIYDSWMNAVPVPDSFVPYAVVRGHELGIGAFSNPSDIFYHQETGEVFLLDTGNHRIVVMDSDMNLVTVIDELDNNGVADAFSSPQGIFVNNTGIFVADTQNNRILVVDHTGNVINEFGRPETDLIAANLAWLPTSVVVDNAGRMYVIAVGINLGLVELSAEGEFRNFKGANRVSFNMVQHIRRRYFSTAEQRARMTLTIPTEFSGVTIDPYGFVYVTTAVGLGMGGVDAVRRLNARGDDILRRLGHMDVVGSMNVVMGQNTSFVDIAVDQNGVFSVLDRPFGRIFTYDNDGNLLDVFGGIGFRKGLLQSPVALTYVGDNIVVVDNFMHNITVYAPTAYGLALRQATYWYYLGDYELSAYYWQIVLDHNANSDLAYIGLGRIEVRNRNFRQAMTYFRFANSRVHYSAAFNRHRRQLIQDNFPIVATSAVVLGIGLFVGFKIKAALSGKEREEAYDVG